MTRFIDQPRIAGRRRRPVAPLVLAAVLALGACSHPRAASPPPPPAAPTAADRSREVAGIVALLERGDTAAASPRIDALLAREPADAQARVLRASIDTDPVALLGARSFAYAVKPGETMPELAERFLGTSLKSYQLARYNGIAVPAALAAGTVLRIPGTAPDAPIVKPKRAPPPAKAPPAPAKSDPIAARQSRAAGLVALNAGQLDRAVTLLRRAAQLDPDDPLIQRDLARAQRVAETVRARPPMR